jgi:hypothetical protein
MTPARVIVTLLGVGAIAWVNWYFFKVKHDHSNV